MPDRYPPDRPLTNDEMDDLVSQMGPRELSVLEFAAKGSVQAWKDSDLQSLQIFKELGETALREQARKSNLAATTAASRADTDVEQVQSITNADFKSQTQDKLTENPPSTAKPPSQPEIEIDAGNRE
jgi:hypothetical protein